jgi:hypothetical protein
LVALAAARVLHPPAEVINRMSKAWPSLVNMQHHAEDARCAFAVIQGV